MALVSDGFSLTVQLKDTGDNSTTRTYELTAATAAAAATDAATIMADLDALTNAVIVGYTIGERFVEDALTLPTSAEVENCAEISAYIVGSPTKTATVNIPAPVPGIFVGTSGKNFNIVDTSDTLVQNFLAHFGNAGEATLSDGEIINPTTASGKRIHKKSRRG